MDAADFQRELEEAKDTELERLASSKLLVALTDADLTAETVLRIAADSERAAADTFDAWADDESDDEARALFAEFRDQEQEHCERVLDLLEDGDEYDPDATGGPMHDQLRPLEGTVPRLGGLIGRALVAERTHLQVVSFFVNEGDERRAERFRELRGETATQGERAAELLAETCEGEGSQDRDRAVTAAEGVIDAAYDAYADSLDDLGIDPKPIC